MKTILLIDNYDSFTYNLKQYFEELGVTVLVYKNDALTTKEAAQLEIDGLVISPGPGSIEKTSDIGESRAILEYFTGKIPILGVCLGHQLLVSIDGGNITKSIPVHGRRWSVKILDKANLFVGFPDKIEGMRYHSMVVEKESLPSNFNIIAETGDEDRLVMAISDSERRLFGVQFHPESIGTPWGLKILENFLSYG
jgi:anthranilate synthase/aminodeoxychorismate synthase-like glutamine amidotransferase